jgi:hypothetical protein
MSETEIERLQEEIVALVFDRQKPLFENLTPHTQDLIQTRLDNLASMLWDFNDKADANFRCFECKAALDDIEKLSVIQEVLVGIEPAQPGELLVVCHRHKSSVFFRIPAEREVE